MNGLALAGGGVKGSYQIGAYLALKKCKIEINGVVGTSIGSFNGCMIASHREYELYNFWKNVDIGALLEFNPKYTKSVNDNDKFKELIYGLEEVGSTIKNKGISNKKMKETLSSLIDEKALFNSNIDFGLVTVRAKDLKPLYIFKRKMIRGKVSDYILASCNLPVFKKTKFIDDKYYLDGGFYDNSPVNALLDRGYKKVYSIEIQGIGFKQKIKDPSKVIEIKPSRNLGSTLNVNKDKINENIKLGFYDTLKIIKNYDGYNYIFKKAKDYRYNFMVSGINEELLKKVKKYLKAENNKEAVIKGIEYIFLKENKTYFKVYSVFSEIRRIRKLDNKHFIYEFVKSLRLI